MTTRDPEQPADPDPLERVLCDAVLVGAELDTRYRVLAVTVEPDADRHPLGAIEDRRLQVLLHPVSTVLALLTRTGEGGERIETFEAEQLPEVGAALAGARLRPPVLGRPEPPPGQWGPQLSMQGRSTAPDGRRRTATVEVAESDAHLRLFVRCDEIELRDPEGEPVPVS